MEQWLWNTINNNADEVIDDDTSSNVVYENARFTC